MISLLLHVLKYRKNLIIKEKPRSNTCMLGAGYEPSF